MQECIALPLSQTTDAAGRFDVTGPHAMSMQEVQQVEPKPGAYILGNDQNRALYVGRANANLRSQPMAHFIPLLFPGVVICWVLVRTRCESVGCLSHRTSVVPPVRADSTTRRTSSRPRLVPVGCPVCGR